MCLQVVDQFSSACVCVFQEHAFESSQKYKEGKYIIEVAHMIKDNGWDWRGTVADVLCADAL